MMGDKRARSGTAIQGLQDGGLNLQEIQVIEVTAHGCNGATANNEDVLDFITIGDEIKVALPLAYLLIF